MPIRPPGPLPRHSLLVPAIGGALLLIVSEFLTLREIKAVTVVPEGGATSGGSHHLYAFVLIGAAMILMSVGAVVGRSRPAAIALLALAAAASVIILAADVPWMNETGLIGRTYDLAEARPAIGFWLEVAGALLVLVSALLVLRRGEFAEVRPERPARRAPRDDAVSRP
jgi:hypothetical protein